MRTPQLRCEIRANAGAADHVDSLLAAVDVSATPITTDRPAIVASVAGSDRLAAQLDDSVSVAADEHFVVERVVKKDDAERVASAAIKERMLRPADIDASEIDPMLLAWVPIWRIDISVSGFNIGLSRARGVTLPTGGTSNRDEVRLVLGRRLLAIDPCTKLVIEPGQLVPYGERRPPGGELVQADVERDEAESEAKEAMRRSVQSGNALFSSAQTEVRSIVLVHYPLMVVRYRYTGEARADLAPEECYVALSGRTGKVIAEKHPSAWRSIGTRIKKLFG